MKKSELKLYRHYKNKPYKYLGPVRHSETLENLVLYESLYENELGPLMGAAQRNVLRKHRD